MPTSSREDFVNGLLGAREAGDVKLRSWEQSTWQVPVRLDGRGRFVLEDARLQSIMTEMSVAGIDTAEML